MESANPPEFKYKNTRFGLVIDWETSGAGFSADDSAEKYQGLSVGIVVFDLKSYEPVDTKYILFQFDPQKYMWDPKAAPVHGLTREFLKENGVTQEEGAIEFASFILKYFTGDEPIGVMGHNVAFDIAFTKQLLVPFKIMFRVDITVLDTSTVSYILAGLHRSEDLFNFLCLPPRKEHNALQDALMELESMKLFRVIFKMGLEHL